MRVSRNRFAGTCYRCGDAVQPGDGHFERRKGVRGWFLQHASCAIQHRGTDKGREPPRISHRDTPND